jgi:hypothetical protein
MLPQAVECVAEIGQWSVATGLIHAFLKPAFNACSLLTADHELTLVSSLGLRALLWSRLLQKDFSVLRRHPDYLDLPC